MCFETTCSKAHKDVSATVKIQLDLLLVERGMTLTQLSETVGVSLPNLSILKRGRARAIRFTTLVAICEALDCAPGDLIQLERSPDL
jgi:putative transcriptional regulator